MRILYMLNTLAIGGAERLVLAIAERMAIRGHSVCVVPLGKERPDELPTNLNVVRLGMDQRPVRALAGLGRGVRVLRAFRPHILHSHNFHGNLIARVLKPSFPSARIISTLHNEYEGGSARMFALRFSEHLSTHTVAVSQAVLERALQQRIAQPEKCRVISNGIDLAGLTPNTERRVALRPVMGADRDFIWLSAGRLVPAKDYPNLLLAFAQVHSAVPATQLWIAGAGDAQYTATLHMKASELGLSQAVHWLGARRDIAALLDVADGFVLGSAWEGMPLAIAEAMAMEKPVVATGVGGVSELLDHCGLAVPPRDPNALARSMLSILNTPEIARGFLGQSARRRIIDHFNMDRKAVEWEALYSEIAGPISE